MHRGRRYSEAVLVLPLLLILGSTGIARADSTPAADFDLGFTTRAPDAKTAATLHILYKAPGDPAAKPSPLRSLTIVLPAGARFDGAAVPACEASDGALMAQGTAACPPASAVGGGTVSTMTGLGPTDPFVLDSTFFNAGNGLIQLFTLRGTNVAVLVAHGEFAAPNKLVFDPVPAVPGGPPDFGTAVREVDVQLDAAGSNRTPFVRTPPTCPKDNDWTSRLFFRTADGNRYRAKSAAPCASGRSERDPRASESPEFSMRFSTKRPSRSTGAVLHGVVHRDDPDREPSPLRTYVLTLPHGARFDGDAVPACTAGDGELQLLGPAACPSASRVAEGTLTVITSAGSPPDPVAADVSVFNWGKGTIELISLPGTNVTPAVDRGEFTGPGQLTNHPPRAPGGPPDFETSVNTLDLTYLDSARGFITTPPRCPSSGEWTTRLSYSTADGRSYDPTGESSCHSGSPSRLKRPARLRGFRSGE